LSFSLFFSFFSFDLLFLQFSAMISFRIFMSIMRLMTLKIDRISCYFFLQSIFFSFRKSCIFDYIWTFLEFMHFIADALSRSWLIIFWFWENRKCWFFWLRLILRLILKNYYISIFDRFQFFFDSVLYSRVVSSKWTFRKIARLCKIQLSQNVEVHFRSAIRNFSTNIISKSKKFLIFSRLIRVLRISHSIT
jgi:hypothetical protein